MEEYRKYLIEAGPPKEIQISKMIGKIAGQKVVKMEKKLRVVFKFQNFIDHEEIENFPIIDKIIKKLEQMYPGAIVKHDWAQFIVEEL